MSERIWAFAPDETTQRWIREELADDQFALEHARSMADIAQWLANAPLDGPDVVIVDFDALPRADLELLSWMRRVKWTGTLIGLGSVAAGLRRRLGVSHVVPRPLGSERLRQAVMDVDRANQTKPMRLPER